MNRTKRGAHKHDASTSARTRGLLVPRGWKAKAPGVYVGSGEVSTVETTKKVTRTVEYWTQKFEAAKKEALAKMDDANACTT